MTTVHAVCRCGAGAVVVLVVVVLAWWIRYGRDVGRRPRSDNPLMAQAEKPSVRSYARHVYLCPVRLSARPQSKFKRLRESAKDVASLQEGYFLLDHGLHSDEIRSRFDLPFSHVWLRFRRTVGVRAEFGLHRGRGPVWWAMTFAEFCLVLPWSFVYRDCVTSRCF
jgi:hypothetical protein